MLKEADKQTSDLGLPHADGLFKFGLIPDWLEKMYFLLMNPVISLLSARAINPNLLSSAGFIMIAVAGYYLLAGRFYFALGFVIAGGIFDSIDGKVATRTNRVTRFGGMYDSVLDRYSDMVVFVALAICFHRQSHYLTALAALAALVGAFMTSYVKAIGKSHGIDTRIGFLRRQERMAVVMVALAFSLLDPYLKHWLGAYWQTMETSPNLIVAAGIWFLALFSNMTAIQRLLKLRQLAANG